MKKLTVKEASEYLGITREAIYNRIRRGSLKSVTEANVKYVIVDEQEAEVKQTANKPQNTTTNYEEHLKEQIKELKDELKTTKEKIEKLYQEKDEQLKSILQITLQSQQRQIMPVNSHESVIEANIKEEKKWIKLTKLLKKLEIKGDKKDKIVRVFSKKVGKSKNVKMKRDKLFVNEHKKFKDIYER